MDRPPETWAQTETEADVELEETATDFPSLDPDRASAISVRLSATALPSLLSQSQHQLLQQR